MPISVKNKISGNLAGIRGPKGETGNGIEKIEKTNTVGVIDTYTITYTNGQKATYEIKNGERGEIGPQGQQGIQGESYDDTQIKQDISNHNTRLNTLETDNTLNKNNISTIQQEQLNQNTNISQNEIDIKLLEENLADEITTEESENLTVKDAARWYSKVNVSGNSVQEQTSQSANLWWDNTTRTFDSADNKIQESSQTIKAGAYTFSCDISNLVLGTNAKMQLHANTYYSDGTSNLTFLLLDNILENKRYSYKFSITGKDIIRIELKVGTALITNGGSMTISNLCLRVDDSSEYVEFVPDSPSPKNSSKIENCKNSINIKVENVNRFNKDTATLKYYAHQDTGELILNASRFVSDYIRIKEDTKYYLKTSTNVHICFFDENKNYVSGRSGTGEIISPVRVSFIRFSPLLSEIDTVYFVEENELEKYIAHEEQTIAFPLKQNQELYLRKLSSRRWNTSYKKANRTKWNGELD